MTNTNEILVGDVVCLKTNDGPLMVASEIDSNKRTVYAEYWHNDQLHHEWVKLAALRQATEAELKRAPETIRAVESETSKRLRKEAETW